MGRRIWVDRIGPLTYKLVVFGFIRRVEMRACYLILGIGWATLVEHAEHERSSSVSVVDYLSVHS